MGKAKSPPPKSKTTTNKGKDVAPSFVEEAVAGEATVETIREQLRVCRDTEARIRDLNSVLSEEAKNLNTLRFEVLPELFASAGIDNLGLPQEGNNPGYDASLSNFYRANIAASWPEEKRKAAFDWLDKSGNGDLIKTEITVTIPRGSNKLAKAVIAALKKLKVDFDVSQSVPHNTLSAFVRECVEERELALPLETLGATIGMVVNMKERKDGK